MFYTKKLRFLLTTVVCLCISAGIWLSAVPNPDTVQASNKRLVKVAFFPMEGYHDKNEDGGFGGMDVDYLESLTKYVNWKVEYVECGSWDEALTLLSEKKVDLVGSAQYSAERARTFQYTDLASGYTFGIIATSNDSDLAYEDFTAMKNITFGMVKTYVRRNEFMHYLRDNAIIAPKIMEYDSTADLQQALENGEIDALVHTFMEVREGQRLIGRFAPRPFYYISYPGNDNVMRELNQAIADMKMNEPALETELMNKYYQSRLDKTIVFTTEEKEFIKNADPVVIGYFDGYYPFVYEDQGTCSGLTRNLLENTAGLAGLTLQWKKLDSPSQASQALTDGTIDVMSYCVHTNEETGENNLTRLREYTQIPLLLVMGKNVESSHIHTLAAVKYLDEDARVVLENEDNAQLLIFDTQLDCLDAVKEKKADAALCDGYLAEYQLSADMHYYNLEIRRVLNQEHGVAMTVRSTDTQLAGILNKILMTIDARAVSDYMMERNLYTIGSVSQFITDHSVAITVILFTLLTAVVLVAVHIFRDTRKIQKLMYKDVDLNIWNLNHLIYAGEKLLVSDKRKHRYAIAYFNLVQFQRYKVVYGWENSQKLLGAIAEELTRCVQSKNEICAKADGDHFVLLLSPELGDIAERLKNICRLTEEYVLSKIGNSIELHVGLRFIPPDGIDMRSALACASQALDFIPAGSAEKIKIFDEALEKTVIERHERQKLLDSINIEDNFTTYYQAKVDVRTEEIVGAEALVRFLDPTASGAVRSPGFFVPYYEQTGKVTELDFFVFGCVCRMLRRRLDHGEPVVTISCNFSRIHFTKPGFVEHLISIMEENRIPKELIEVEITETIVMEELQQEMAEQTMHDLYVRGIHLSIDDFGAGYSSLGVIEKIPASVIKLDRSFLLNQTNRERQIKIMKRIVDMAGDLNAQIVCEGIETDSDVELMREIGATVAQGYRYARPVDENEFETRLTGDAARC